MRIDKTHMKKWKRFEDKTHKLLQEFNPTADVYKNIFIKGLFSKKRRQVDVKMVKPDEYDFIAFECKDYKRPLDIPIIEGFNTKLKDINAKKGAIVSNSPFTEGAINMASEFKIDLLNLVDTADKDIRAQLFAKGLIADTQCKGYSLGFSSTAQMGGGVSLEPSQIFFIDDNGKRASSRRIFAQLWNSTQDLSTQPGYYKYTPPEQNKKKILSIDDIAIPLNTVCFNYEVIERFFIGNIEIIDAKGLFNVKEGSFQTRSITTEKVSAFDKEKIWEEVTADEAKKRFHTFGFSCVSLYDLSQID